MPESMQLSRVIREHPQPILIFLVLAPILSVVATPFVSVFFADVEIETDKEFYESNESIIVSVNATGYLFRAELETLECGAFKTSINDRGVFRIPANLVGGVAAIRVEFRPQVIPIKPEKFKHIRIVKNAS